ncbi:MAG: disulfide bond formation protein B [Piscinibacter sp.]|uniref:disulfide bond formation protein B n=1 Tax=Piscinibacter sp. TaxID=1903157 RepID=UPI002590094F|nr:disulfide bond formation protein B [Piscinibacter sp.]MCW5663354.1 disulfide bond formation protein B [Piscinibacter sp.]
MSPRAAAWLIAAASFASVVAALVAQHGFGMQPCPWCILQRIVFLLVGLVALLAALGGGLLRRLLGLLIVPLALAGAAAALYQHFVAAKSTSCDLTFADRLIRSLRLDSLLPAVFEVRGSCADAAVDLFGVPFEFWSLALFVLLAAGAVVLVRGAPR